MTVVVADSSPLNYLVLDDGERAAISLAFAQPPEAERRMIPVVGTLGVLRAAAIRGLVKLKLALNRLVNTDFRCSSALIDELLAPRMCNGCSILAEVAEGLKSKPSPASSLFCP